MSEARRHIFHVFSTFAVGGPQARFATIANALAARHRHTILAMDANYAAAGRLGAQVEFNLCNDVTPAKRRTLTNILAFRRILDSVRPDLLVTYNWGAMEWAMANTPRLIPQIHVEDGFGPEEAGGQLARRVWFRRLALAGKTVVVASRVLEATARKDWRVPVRRLRFIANGVDASRFTVVPGAEIGARLAPIGDGPLIGTIAALRPEKNLSRLVEAFSIVNRRIPARLAIVGDGPERGAIEAKARALGVETRVFLPGYVADASAVAGAFDLFMLSSDTEQAPVSLLEAMAAARAVVATNVGDVALMTAPENRPYIVAPEAPALAEAALRLLGDPSLRRRIGDANRAKCAADYSQTAMIDAWEKLFDGLTD